MRKLAIMVSGSGTNMENLIRKTQGGHVPGLETALVISDTPAALAITKAENLGIPVTVVDRKDFSGKPEFEARMIQELEAKEIDLIALAGFMRILSVDFVRRYKGRLINIHPSLLPAFPGAHGIKDAFESGINETGVTVHYVDEGVDTGPIIVQEKVSIQPNDTLETLEARIHAVEYRLYPEALRQVLAGKA